MSSDLEYDSIPIPDEKRPEAYTYAQRRAEELQLILEAGHPRAVNQTELAARYGVSQQQISKDFDTLSEYVSASLGADLEFTMETVLHGAMLSLIEEGEAYKAARVAKWWGEWIDRSTSEAQTHPAPSMPVMGELDDEEEAMIDQITRYAGSPENDVTL